ncbi:MAG: pentapeptide repeat-containing protein [Candidatus Hodarchaeota archaeon]
MKLSSIILTILIAFEMVAFCNLAFSNEKKEPWIGTLKDGTIIDEDDLKKILSGHVRWLNEEKKKEKADLQVNEPQKPDLLVAEPQKADLQGADLQGADLSEANLQGADLSEANLQGAHLEKANLQGADLSEANLQGAHLSEANLQDTFLYQTNLQNADLYRAYLQKTLFQEANLQGAYLEKANLQEAGIWITNLKNATLWEANLKGAKLRNTNLDGAIFEIKPNNLPDIPSTADAKNLSSLTYKGSPHALVELRTAFKKFGLRKPEREITYAIKHTGYEKAIKNGNLLTKIEVILGWLFFEMTCKWGMSPERPLFILLGLIFFFTIPYAQAISQDIYGKEKSDGIWKVWIPERMRNDLGQNKPKELLDSINPWFCFKTGFYFSLLSAFNIGWRELNVGNWITRIQPYEYRFYASGWARSVSGIQSIISVYLLALSVLTYFGRPFESY